MLRNNIIQRPITSEKNTDLAQWHNQYAFEVAMDANRIEIRNAIEKAFGVKVTRVATMICRREPQRAGRSLGKRKLWKKAIVTLKEGEKFEFIAS